MNDDSVPVLMYHSISDSPPRATSSLSVSRRDFAAQMQHLQDLEFTCLTFGDFCARRRSGIPMPRRPVVLTFDDGYGDAHDAVLPILTEFGFPATVFVTTGWVRDAGPMAAGAPLDRTLSWSEIAELDSAGIEIGAHSHSHPELDQLPERLLRVELRRSRELLEDRLGRLVNSLAFPYGYASNLVTDTARDIGYHQGAAVANRPAAPWNDSFELPRLTIRRSTSSSAFARIVAQHHLGLQFAGAHGLTAAWARVRRLRRMTRSLEEAVSVPRSNTKGRS